MKRSALKLIQKGFKLSFQNLWRNKFLSLATVFVIAIIVFIFNVILAVNFIAGNSLKELNQKLDINAYLKESTSEDQANQIISKLEQIPEVIQAEYFSKDDALQQIKSSNPDISIAFEKYGLDNPLPASINIRTQAPEDHQKIFEFLAQSEYSSLFSNINTLENPDSRGLITSVSKNLSKLNQFTRQLVFWLVTTFLLGGILIVLNAVQVTMFSRRREIEVMKLVGAPYWFIRFPFLIEAATYAILSVLLSFVMLYFLSQNISLPIDNNWSHILLIELAATIIISILSSTIAVHEYLFRRTP